MRRKSSPRDRPQCEPDLTLASLPLVGCNGTTQPVEIAQGIDPQIVDPDPSLLPTINVAEAERWSQGGTPVGASGLHVTTLAIGLDHPHWLHVLPNGHVLVAETTLSLAIAFLPGTNRKRLSKTIASLGTGANASVLPIFNTASLVGFGGVIASLPAFDLVQSLIEGVGGDPTTALPKALRLP